MVDGLGRGVPDGVYCKTQMARISFLDYTHSGTIGSRTYVQVMENVVSVTFHDVNKGILFMSSVPRLSVSLKRFIIFHLGLE